MHKKLTIALLILINASMTIAQQNTSSQEDDMKALRSFAQLGQLYKRMPVQLNIHIQNTASLVVKPSDTMQADMQLYYSAMHFYMQAEGLEEIVNDSMIIMVNSQTKQIILYPNNQQVIKSIEKSVAMFMPDSSVERMAANYHATAQDMGHKKIKIELKNKANVYGTDMPRDIIRLIYQQDTYEPVEFVQKRTSLLPVDSAIFKGMKNDPAYNGKLVTSPAAKGELYFLVKELTTTFSFNKITHGITQPPAREQDRIIKGVDGNYQPAKGYEEYQLKKQN